MKAKELLDKYITYDSKITFDIFKLMYQKLIDLGFTSPHTVEYAFKEFSGRFKYFILKLYNGEKYFNQFNSVNADKSEISVEDLLGYNPFESFKLPEKWCIKVMDNSNNYPELEKWRGRWSHSGISYIRSDSSWTANCPKDSIEITLEQFKQYVLKEPTMTKSSKPFPTHWCIELNKETIPIVGVYYNKKHLSDPKCNKYTGDGVIGCYVKSHNSKNEYVKNGYTNCSFFSEPSDSYPEITLEEFKEFVMNEPVKTEITETEKDWSKATKEELLEEARRKYPMGTEYTPLESDGTLGCYIKDVYKVCHSPRYINGGIDCGIGYIYAKGNWAKIISLPETKVEEVVPEYVECFYSTTSTFIINKIYKCDPLIKTNNLTLNSERGLISNLPYDGALWKFKPSTKEAFEAQNKPKSIEKWSVGSYGVVINSTDKKFPIGFIDEIIPTWHKKVEFKNYRSYDPKDLEYNSGLEFKWFATKPEAEEFAKTLIEPIKEESKTLLKQAVHCKTQEEWDFVLSKLPSTCLLSAQSEEFEEFIEENPSGIAINTVNCEWSDLEWWEEEGYQILSFQEWCDLNGYKMTKTRFKKGDYVVSLRPEYLSTFSIKYNYCYIQYKDGDKISTDSGTTMYEDDVNFARLATPEEIEEYKRIGKPYDVTTLQSKTINTYGLNIGDKLDAIIIAAWEKQGFNYLSDSNDKWRVGSGLAYDNNRNIKGFKIKNGVVGFLVSGTLGIYLKAEGFKEFAENYNKLKESMVKFEIDKWYKVCNGKFNIPHDTLYYVKSPKIINNIITVDQYLYNGYLGQEGNFGHIGDYTFVEVPLSEIQHLLPEGHPDLVNTVNKEVKDISKTFTIRVTSREVKRINI